MSKRSTRLFYPIRYNTQRDGFGGRRLGRRSRAAAAEYGRHHRDHSRRRQFPPAGGGGGGGGGRRGGGGSGSANDYETGQKYLEALAQNSGGTNFEADTTYNLDAAFSGIAEELRRQYSLGYYPENVGQIGDRKQIKVRVMRPNLSSEQNRATLSARIPTPANSPD